MALGKLRKKTELWIRIKASLLFSTGTDLSAAVQPWVKKLKAWIPQPSRARTVRRAETSRFTCTSPVPRNSGCQQARQLAQPARQRLGEVASYPLKTRKITLLFPPSIVTHSEAISGQNQAIKCR